MLRAKIHRREATLLHTSGDAAEYRVVLDRVGENGSVTHVPLWLAFHTVKYHFITALTPPQQFRQQLRQSGKMRVSKEEKKVYNRKNFDPKHALDDAFV